MEKERGECVWREREREHKSVCGEKEGESVCGERERGECVWREKEGGVCMERERA